MRAQRERQRGLDPIEAERERQKQAAEAITVEDLTRNYIVGYAQPKTLSRYNSTWMPSSIT
jgi:hypothetical protein